MVCLASLRANFASDRSHMRSQEDGTWLAEPPPYPAIAVDHSKNNLLDKWLQVGDASVGHGKVSDAYGTLTTTAGLGALLAASPPE